MGVYMLVRLIESDAQLRIAAKGEGLVHADTVHRDQHVQRHIAALQLFRDQLRCAGGVFLCLRCDTGFTCVHLPPLFFGNGSHSVGRDSKATSYCPLTITRSESVDDAFSGHKRTELSVMPSRFGLRGNSDHGVLGSERMLTVIRLAHDQVNV